MLQCHVKGCINSFPLTISDAEVEYLEADFNQDFITRIIQKLDWTVLVNTCRSVKKTF